MLCAKSFPLWLALLAVFIARPGAAGQLDLKALESRIDSLVLVEKKVSPEDPGYAVAVLLDGRVIFRKGYGLANLERKAPVTPSTSFNLCSMSKQFTAACIVLLEREGKLSLDEDIHRYLPDLPDYGHKVTVRHLLHHTSGIWSTDWLTILSGRKFSDPASTRDELEMIFRTRTLNFEPGAEYMYSNSNYVLLGEIVRRLSGKPLSAFARERIFEPLGMRRTFLHDGTGPEPDNVALGYYLAPDSSWQPAGAESNTCVGSNNVYSTVEDLARWEDNFYTQKVGGPGFTQAMQTRGVLNSGDTLDYALGLEVSRIGGQLTVSHGGGDSGFRTYLMRLPEHRLSVVFLCNSDQGQPVGSTRKTIKFVLGEHIFDRPESAAAAAAPVAPAPVVRPDSAALELCCGQYCLPDGYVVTITRRDSLLQGRLTGQESTPFLLAAESDSLYHLVDAPEIKLTFFGTGTGPSESGTFHQDRDLAMTRVPERIPDAAWLEGFAGQYRSDELNTTYRVEALPDCLVLHSGILEPTILEENHLTGHDRLLYSGADTFSLSYIPVVFSRDSDGRVSGFSLDVGRIRNVRFTRR